MGPVGELFVNRSIFERHLANYTKEVDELGLRDYLDEVCLLLVEWPEKVANEKHLQASAKLAFSHLPDGSRQIVVA